MCTSPLLKHPKLAHPKDYGTRPEGFIVRRRLVQPIAALAETWQTWHDTATSSALPPQGVAALQVLPQPGDAAELLADPRVPDVVVGDGHGVPSAEPTMAYADDTYAVHLAVASAAPVFF